MIESSRKSAPSEALFPETSDRAIRHQHTMAASSPTYSATVEMPMMNKMRSMMLQILDSHASFFEFVRFFPEVVKDLQAYMDKRVSTDSKLTLRRTIEDFQTKTREMERLTHHVSPRLLRSIIQGTVAFDKEQRKLQPSDSYNEDTASGTYVVSVAIRGRKGAFLNPNELSDLSELLEKYANAGEEYLKGDKKWDPLDATNEALRQFVRRVEGRFCEVGADKAPKFASTSNEITSLRLLANNMRFRSVEGLKMDPTGQTHQIQAPLMVGCTFKSFSERLKAHDPNPKPQPANLSSTTHTWGILICALKDMGLSPKVVKLPALAYYNSEDLHLSERLLSTLGQSYVFQGGLNVIQAGSHKGDPLPVERVQSLKVAVFKERSLLKANLDRTCNRMQFFSNRATMQRHHTKYFRRQVLDSAMAALETSVSKAESAKDRYLEAKKSVVERDQKMGKRNKEMKVIIEAVQDLKTFAEAIQRFKAQRESSL